MRYASLARTPPESNAARGRFFHRDSRSLAPPTLIEKQNALTHKEMLDLSRELARKAELEFVKVEIGTGKKAGKAQIGYEKLAGTYTMTIGENFSKLSKTAVRGVVGHELKHIETERDWGFLPILAAPPLLGWMAFALSIFKEAGSLSVPTVLLGAASILATLLIHRRIQRFEEAITDKKSAKLNGTGKGMIELFEKVAAEWGQDTAYSRHDKPILAKAWDTIKFLFSDHPKLSTRIRKLEKLEPTLARQPETG